MRRLIQTCLCLIALVALAHPRVAAATGKLAAEVAPGSLPGLRIAVAERGMHRLTYEQMSAAGAPVATLRPDQFALWQRDEAVAAEITGAADGRFDPGDALIFYGKPYTGRYMTRNIYRLTWSGGGGEWMPALPALPQGPRESTAVIQQRVRIERNSIYYSGYTDLPRDADHLFDTALYANSAIPTAAISYVVNLPHLVPSGRAEVRVGAHGGRALPGRNPDQSLRLRLNGVDLGASTWDGSVSAVISRSLPSALLTSTAYTLTLETSLSQLPGIDYYWVSPDWIEIVYRAWARATADRLYIEAVGESGPVQPRLFLPVAMSGGTAGAGAPVAPSDAIEAQVSGFTTSGVRVYDVTDPRRPAVASAQESFTSDGYAVRFTASREASYALAAPGGYLTPASVEYDAGSTWRTPDNRADYIAIVHRSLWDAIQPLLDHRAAEGLVVAKVDVQDVYDEFSGGLVDPEAIRAFLGYAYRTWNAGGNRPQYVLLVGDGSYDFKRELNPKSAILIPPYLLPVDPSIGETAADNRYASVDGDDDFLPDMALGRIPAQTPEEVTAVVNKVLTYERSAPAGDWQKRTVFVADRKDDPAGNFHALSDLAQAEMPAGYEKVTIYDTRAKGSTEGPAKMKAAIAAAFDSGAVYLQWFGHASKTFWGNDRVWESADVGRLAANTTWPFTAHYSCWSGYFINVTSLSQPTDRSLGEAMLLTPGRGSLADFSPSGLHVGSALQGLNRELIRAIFVNRIDRVGKATDAARKAYHEGQLGPSDLIDTQVLLGDPATKLKLP